MCPDHVLFDEVLEEALVDEVHHRRRERQQIAREALHLLGHLHAGHALAEQRLVDVQVEEPHLGVGDLGQRLAVHAAELEKRHQREARVQDRCHVVERLDVLVGQLVEPAGGQPQARPEALDQRGLETCELGRLVERVKRPLAVEHVLDVAVGEPALVTRALDLLERVAAVAQPRDDPRMGHRGARPFAAAVHLGDDAVTRPAAQRVR